jgi:hypothetical protein
MAAVGNRVKPSQTEKPRREFAPAAVEFFSHLG